ncbi:MAG TPA: hypothetical protein VMT15_10730 [Bryobacteraceae bacterium]|nr:hypothetical protein [Bryobacteraceae bacterium]
MKSGTGDGTIAGHSEASAIQLGLYWMRSPASDHRQRRSSVLESHAIFIARTS